MSLASTIDQGLSDALKEIVPDMFRDIDISLAQCGTVENVLSNVEKVRMQMGKQKPLHTNTVETMIEAIIRGS